MRAYGKVIVLIALALLFSGSMVPEILAINVDNSAQWAITMERLLAEQDADLETYRQELQQAGEDLFAEQRDQLRRAQEQKLQNAARALKVEIEAEGQALQDKLAKEILNRQLQLVLVSLNQEQQLEKLNEISQLQDQLAGWQSKAQEDLKERLAQLKVEHEELGQQEILRMQSQLEQAMAQDFAQYRQARLRDFEEEMSNLAPELRSAFLNR